MTPETAAELERLGVKVPRGVQVAAPDEKPWAIICPTHEGGPLILPDNRIALCEGTCGRMVQHRPHAPAVPKVCMDCAPEFYKKVMTV
jgi:hypothetical protein